MHLHFPFTDTGEPVIFDIGLQPLPDLLRRHRRGAGRQVTIDFRVRMEIQKVLKIGFDKRQNAQPCGLQKVLSQSVHPEKRGRAGTRPQKLRYAVDPENLPKHS